MRGSDGKYYDIKGDYYKCSKCDQWSVHKDNQIKCVNLNCKSNSKKPCKTCYVKLKESHYKPEYNGNCQSCFGREKARM